MTDEPRQIRVLLVEDERADQVLVTQMLAEASTRHLFAPTCVDRVSEARRHLREAGADVVLLDLSLPDAAGLQGLRDLLALTPRRPLIVLTGNEDDAVSLEAVREGAQDYLQKRHLNAPWLRSAILFAIERQQLLHTIEQMQERILRLERDRAVAEIAGGAAHEINNPLTTVVGQLDLLLRESRDDGLRERLGLVRRELDRVTDVVRRMRQTTSHRTRPYVGGHRIADLGADDDARSGPE